MWRSSQLVSRGILSRDLSAHGNDIKSRAGDHVTGRRKNRAHGKRALGSRGDVSMRSPTSRGDVSETSSEFLSRLQ